MYTCGRDVLLVCETMNFGEHRLNMTGLTPRFTQQYSRVRDNVWLPCATRGGAGGEGEGRTAWLSALSGATVLSFIGVRRGAAVPVACLPSLLSL